MKRNERNYKVVSSNKRERTITIQCTYEDGSKVKYRSNQLSKDEWEYYVHYATENDIKQFLKTDDYYLIKK